MSDFLLLTLHMPRLVVNINRLKRVCAIIPKTSEPRGQREGGGGQSVFSPLQ